MTENKTEVKKEKPNLKRILHNISRMFKMTGKYFKSWGLLRIIGGFVIAVAGLLVPRLIGESLNIAIEGDKNKLIFFIVALAALTVCICTVGALNSLTSYRYTILSGRKLRYEAMNKINRLPIAYFENKHTGEVLSKIVNDIDKMASYYGDAAGSLFSYMPATTIFGLYLLFNINIKLTLICISVIPVISIIIMKISLPIADSSKKAKEHAAVYNSYLRDFFEGIEIYKIFSMEKRHGRKFCESVDAATKENIKKLKKQQLSWVLGGFSYLLPWIMSYTIGGLFVAKGEMNIGDLFAFAAVLPYVTNMTWQISKSWATLVDVTGTASHYYELLDEPEERTDGKDYTGRAAALEFKNVSYSYPNGLAILKNCSFKVEAGKTVAVVGASGCGKSTLFKMLCGYYRDYEGKIYINGKELSEWNLNALRRMTAYVSQESYLFDDTIMENIRFGNLEATDEEVVEAAKGAWADEFIRSFPEGYNTKLGERGVRLSGGERQRLAIARAILKQASLILLDEPTAALDTRAEFHVQQALENLAREKTVFVAAHRLSTINHADNIIVIDGGEVVEQGTHAELTKLRGRYTELYESQLREEDDNAV